MHSEKKRTRKKIPGAPRRPLSAYNLFFADTRARMMLERDGMTGGFATLAKTVASLWTALPQQEKQQYVEQAREHKEKYRLLLKEFEKTTAYIEVDNARKALKRLYRAKYRKTHMRKKTLPTSSPPTVISYSQPIQNLCNDFAILCNANNEKIEIPFESRQFRYTHVETDQRVVLDNDILSVLSDTFTCNDAWESVCKPEYAAPMEILCGNDQGTTARHEPEEMMNGTNPNNHVIIHYDQRHKWNDDRIWNAYFPASKTIKGNIHDHERTKSKTLEL
jgi:HMG (high mobility group) box